MKRSVWLFVLTIVFALGSCTTKDKIKGDYKLLPLPQEFEITGISSLTANDIKSVFSADKIDLPKLGEFTAKLSQVDAEANAQVVLGIDANLDLKPEGYAMEISDSQVKIKGKDKAGLLYGLMSLEQMLEDATEQKANLPLCSIKDFPALAYRAIHVDVKHHLEKTEYYYKLMDKLARYKINAIILEAEDKIKYEKQPLVGSADALSISEWKKLSDYAMERNIEISPLIQGLGHASFILKHEEYKELRDDPKSDWAFNPLDPKTYEVQFDLYLDAIKATPHGKYLHVGGDEVHTTGRKSGKSSLELQLDWLAKVSKFAEENNRIPIFWDDMPLKHAGVYRPMFNTKMTDAQVDSIWAKNEHKLTEFLDVFPKNCIYMRWNYSSPEAKGNSKAMQWFTDHNLQVMGATAGQTRWTLMPQNQSNMNNIKSFATSSIKNGLNGLLLTLWDDDSPHFELYNRGIISFAEFTWSGEKRTNDEIKSAYRQREFSSTLSDANFAFIDELEAPVANWKNLLLTGKVPRNNLMRNKENIEELVMSMPQKEERGKWSKTHAAKIEQAKATLEKCNAIAAKIGVVKEKAIRNNYTLEVYEQVNKLVRFNNEMLLTLNKYDVAKNLEEEAFALREIKQLPTKFTELRNELESVYGKTRILNKPAKYILDQDHHTHSANQTINFDWFFMGEIHFLKKLEKSLE